MANFDDFDANLSAEDAFGEDFSQLCGRCGTDHSNPDDEWSCLEGQCDEEDNEPADIDDDTDFNPYMGMREDDDFHYDDWQSESDIMNEW